MIAAQLILQGYLDKVRRDNTADMLSRSHHSGGLRHLRQVRSFGTARHTGGLGPGSFRP